MHVDVFCATVAAAGHQLVAHVLHGVRVRDLVALGTVGDHAHPRVLVAHVALGDIFLGVAVVGQLRRVQELVPAMQRNIALELGFGFRAANLVAFDVGGLLDPGFGIADGLLCIDECRDRILDRAQAPVVRAIFGGVCGERQADAQRQRQQAKGSAHAGIRQRKSDVSLPYPWGSGNASGAGSGTGCRPPPRAVRASERNERRGPPERSHHGINAPTWATLDSPSACRSYPPSSSETTRPPAWRSAIKTSSRVNQA